MGSRMQDRSVSPDSDSFAKAPGAAHRARLAIGNRAPTGGATIRGALHVIGDVGTMQSGSELHAPLNGGLTRK